MAPNDDDPGWDDDPLVRALRAPGTPEELSAEAEYRAVFGAELGAELGAGPGAQHVRGGAVRRLVGRLGIGATTAVTGVALSAGVAAAAYTQVLPDPVQHAAHGLLGRLNVPDSKPAHPRVRTVSPRTTPTPGTPVTHAPTSTPSRAPHPGTKTSVPPQAVVTPQPTGKPTSTPTASPPATGTAKPPVRVPAALSMTVSSRKVPFGTVVSVSGTVTSIDGHLLRNNVVRLQGRTTGQAWTRLTAGTTDASGHVTLQTPGLTRNTRLRLVTTHAVHSTPVAVVVQPIMNASVAESSGTSTVTVSCQGGQAGDTVTAYRKQGGKLVKAGTATLDANGSAVLSVPTPKRSARLVLVLGATGQHGTARTTVTLGP